MKKLVRSKIILKEKFKPGGEYEKLKSRLVAQQYKNTVYSEERASPTIMTSGLFMLAGLAAREGREVATMDFPGAYLNADMIDYQAF
jgi:hypothetical protein